MPATTLDQVATDDKKPDLEDDLSRFDVELGISQGLLFAVIIAGASKYHFNCGNYKTAALAAISFFFGFGFANLWPYYVPFKKVYSPVRNKAVYVFRKGVNKLIEEYHSARDIFNKKLVH